MPFVISSKKINNIMYAHFSFLCMKVQEEISFNEFGIILFLKIQNKRYFEETHLVNYSILELKQETVIFQNHLHAEPASFCLKMSWKYSRNISFSRLFFSTRVSSSQDVYFSAKYGLFYQIVVRSSFIQFLLNQLGMSSI